MEISALQHKIEKEEYRISEHAIKRMIQRGIARVEVAEAILNGDIIEEYPRDKYSPSCLICGETKSGRLLHIQVSLPPNVVIITTYEPSPSEWVAGRIRR